MRERHFDAAEVVATVWILCIMIGVVPFTKVTVGAAILLTMCHLRWTWSR